MMDHGSLQLFNTGVMKIDTTIAIADFNGQSIASWWINTRKYFVTVFGHWNNDSLSDKYHLHYCVSFQASDIWMNDRVSSMVDARYR